MKQRAPSIWITAILTVAIGCGDEERAIQSAAGIAGGPQRGCSLCNAEKMVACSPSIGPHANNAATIKLLREASERALRVMEKDEMGPSLLLSGGGSYGAWGAGVLYGRQLQAGSNPYEFDCITGVSTGALMATLVFIGDYEKLKAVYTTVKESDVQRLNWYTIFWRAMYSREPLRKLAEKLMNEEFPPGQGMTRFERVKEQANAGRLLEVGTVNLKNGQFCTWDMSCIACEGKKDTYLDVVMGSANAPAIGPPVDMEIKGEKGQHVDGGTRAQIFAQALLESKILGPDAYFLVNGKIERGIAEQEDGWSDGFLPIVPIAMRGLEILEHEALTLVLQYFQKYLRANQQTVYLSRTPGDACLDFKKREFPKEKMARLFRDGCQWGSNASSWPLWNGLDMPAPIPSGSWPDPSDKCLAGLDLPDGPCETN